MKIVKRELSANILNIESIRKGFLFDLLFEKLLLKRGTARKSTAQSGFINEFKLRAHWNSIRNTGYVHAIV